MTNTVQIYVALLDEGTDVWRPVQARMVDAETYEIMEATPAAESWQFRAGARVRCRARTFSDGESHLVAYEAVKP